MDQCQAHSMDQEHWRASQGHNPYFTAFGLVQRHTAHQKMSKYLYNCHLPKSEENSSGDSGSAGDMANSLWKMMFLSSLH